MKKILVLILSCALLATAFVGCGKKNENEFVLGFDKDFAPMGFLDPTTDEFTGFDIEVAREVCTLLGWELKLKPVVWEQKETDLNSNKIDCIWNGYSVDDDRKSKVLFSDAYLRNDQVIVINKSNAATYKTSADLVGKKLIYQNGSTAEKAVKNSDNLKNNDTVAPEDNVKALLFLDQNKEGAQAAVMDSVIANYYTNLASNKDKFVVLDEVLAEEVYAIGFRKADTEKCEAVNGALKKLKENGKLAEISTKWFGKDITII